MQKVNEYKEGEVEKILADVAVPTRYSSRYTITNANDRCAPLKERARCIDSTEGWRRNARDKGVIIGGIYAGRGGNAAE